MLDLSLTSWVMAGVLVLLVYRWLSASSDLPPGPLALPIVGNLLSMARFPDLCMRLAERFGPVSRVWAGPNLMIVLSSVETIHEAFVKQSENFSNRPDYLYLINEESKRSGKGVLWQSGPAWKLIRRLMLQTMRDFGVGRRSLEERIQEEVTVVSSRLEAAQGSPYVIKADLLRATTNVICTIVFGRRWDYEDPEFQKLMDNLTALFKSQGLLHPISILPWLRFFNFFSKTADEYQQRLTYLFGFLLKHVEEHEATFDPNDPRDLVDVYLKAQRDGMDSDVVSTKNMLRGIMDVFVAGSETTATSMDWCIFFMLLHPEVQTRCQEEIDQVVGSNRIVNMSDRSKLPYVNASLCEALRLGNTGPLSLPHFTTRETTVGGFTIPAKTTVLANLRAVHYNPDLWPDPMTFRPERFLDDEGRLIKTDNSFIPFSIGPRVCLGEPLARMEIFLFLANLLQRFSFAKVQGAVLDTRAQPGITYGPKEYQLIATRR